ncbi:Uncharacterised protein [Mycobacteroides abscessus subsp. massiliense]|nr:Uncharacterised protein [Mycobacteroides abscessus subsp. massiliense]
MQRLEEPRHQEVEVRQKGHRTGDQQSIARPPVPLPDSTPGQPRVQNPNTNHVARHGEPVMLQKSDQVLVHLV